MPPLQIHLRLPRFYMQVLSPILEKKTITESLNLRSGRTIMDTYAK